MSENNKKPKIVYTTSAVANVFNDGTIEIHEDLNLPEYESLRDSILNHEKTHDYSKGFLYNLQVDLFNFVSSRGLLRFMITRPKTWIQLLPFYYTERRGFIYDKNIIFFYSFIAASIFILIKFIGG